MIKYREIGRKSLFFSYIHRDKIINKSILLYYLEYVVLIILKTVCLDLF